MLKLLYHFNALFMFQRAMRAMFILYFELIDLFLCGTYIVEAIVMHVSFGGFLLREAIVNVLVLSKISNFLLLSDVSMVH